MHSFISSNFCYLNAIGDHIGVFFPPTIVMILIPWHNITITTIQPQCGHSERSTRVIRNTNDASMQAIKNSLYSRISVLPAVKFKYEVKGNKDSLNRGDCVVCQLC